jgi:site-specific recombinase XerD
MSDVFRRSKIIEIAKEIPSLTKPKYPHKLRDRALFCLLYLTGARIGELVKRLKKGDFEFVSVRSKPFLIVELYTEKNRRHPIRKIPIPVEKEKQLIDFVTEYLDKLEGDSVVFNFTIQRAWQITKNVLDNHKKKYKNKFMNANHFLRHCRLTHLVTIYDFTDQDLVRFAGWTNSIPATTYAHLRYKDLARKMI